MNYKNTHYRTIWVENEQLRLIDQRHLPHKFVIESPRKVEEVFYIIKDMHVRGAPLIGVTAAYGLWLASCNDPADSNLKTVAAYLKEARPTAVNLQWALDRQLQLALSTAESDRRTVLRAQADKMAEEDVAINTSIGLHGLELIEQLAKTKSGPVNVLTHCNAGWLATVDRGTATAAIYAAREKGIDVHVWVDETRPRNQGARLTAWELDSEGIPHTIIADNTGGHLMQHGKVDLVITGTDRTTRCGDVGNKIGTYLKALAAKDNNVPFYVALPSPTIDWTIKDGIREIPIEQRGAEEVHFIQGKLEDGQIAKVRLSPENSPAANYAFDVTPSRLITGLITERGVCEASETGLLSLFPEFK